MERLYIWCGEELRERFLALERDYRRRVRRGELPRKGRLTHAEFLSYLLDLYESRHRVDRPVYWR